MRTRWTVAPNSCSWPSGCQSLSVPRGYTLSEHRLSHPVPPGPFPTQCSGPHPLHPPSTTAVTPSSAHLEPLPAASPAFLLPSRDFSDQSCRRPPPPMTRLLLPLPQQAFSPAPESGEAEWSCYCSLVGWSEPEVPLSSMLMPHCSSALFTHPSSTSYQ